VRKGEEFGDMFRQGHEQTEARERYFSEMKTHYEHQLTELSHKAQVYLAYVAVCCSVLQCVAECCSCTVLRYVLRSVVVCCSVLQQQLTELSQKARVSLAYVAVSLACVAVCCGVLQCVAVCCSVLQLQYVTIFVSFFLSVLPCHTRLGFLSRNVKCVSRVCCGVLRCLAACCSVLQLQCVTMCVAVCCGVLQYQLTELSHKAWGSLAYVAVCCSVLQSVATPVD